MSPAGVETLVHVLGEGEPADPALVGGKAASVDRLARLGFATPPGFCLTVAAHRAHVEQPDAVRAALATRLDALRARLPSGARLAVRSSATDEDGAGASFAGVHESVLGVECDAGAVTSAVQRCWASLRSSAALAYRERRGLGEEAGMAVIVQQLVEAESAAVAFSKDPVSGSEREVLVAATEGLGEEIMAGGGDAVTFRVDRSTRRLLNVDGAAGPWPISLGELHELVEITLTVEREYGGPVDVEAALAEGSWIVVQARAVTT